jgi:hypothetical protein
LFRVLCHAVAPIVRIDPAKDVDETRMESRNLTSSYCDV